MEKLARNGVSHYGRNCKNYSSFYKGAWLAVGFARSLLSHDTEPIWLRVCSALRFLIEKVGKVLSAKIKQIQTVTDSEISDIHFLMRQLSANAELPSRDKFSELLNDRNLVVLGAFDGERIVGTLSLVFYRLISGTRARIEDVVVHENSQGLGVGRLLCQYAIEIYHASGARTLDLTSTPKRLAANRLYLSLGFIERETNVYRLND